MRYLRALWRSLRLVRPVAWGMVVLSAGMQIACFPVVGPLPYWRSSVCWIALVPLFLALHLSNKDGRKSGWMAGFALGYFCGVLTYLGNCYWIYQTMYLYGGLPKVLALSILILFSFYLALYHALFALLFTKADRFRSVFALILAPFFWVVVELARARVTGLPWDLLGYAEVGNLLLTRMAPFAGVMGISFVIVCANAVIAAGLSNFRSRRLLIVGTACAIALAVQISGKLFAPPVGPTNSTVVLMQENLAVGMQRQEAQAMTEASEIATFSDASLHPFISTGGPGDHAHWSAGEAPRSDVVIWPEAPSLMRWDSPYFLDRLGSLARQSGAAVIVGSVGQERDPKIKRGFASYDSASFFDRDGIYRGRYDKVHLVPWGEYVPYQQFFSFAANLTEDVGDIDPGTSRTGLHAGGHIYGVFICYESIFGDEIRSFVKNGADVLVNISDDGWYEGTGAPFQHLDMTRMRAIENHRYVLQSTNTGVTTVIDPYGRTAIQAPRRVRGAFALPFAYMNGTTFYTRHGDWFASLCVLISLGGLAWCVFSRARAIE